MALLVATFLRFMVATHDPLWLDEQHTAWCSHTSCDQTTVELRARLGNQQPLYFRTIRLFRGGLALLSFDPDSILSLRLPTILAGLGVLGMACHLCHTWTKCWVATAGVACFIAIDQEFLFYGTEARPYAGMQLASMFQIYFFWHWLKQTGIVPGLDQPAQTQTKSALLYASGVVASSLLIIQFHITGVWLLLAELILLASVFAGSFFRTTWRQRIAWRSLLISGGLVVALLSLFLVKTWHDNTGLVVRSENWKLISQPADLMWQLVAVLGSWSLILSLVWGLNFLSHRTKAKSSQPPPSKPKQLLTTDASAGSIGNPRFCWAMGLVVLWSLVPMLAVLVCEATGIAPLALKRYALVGSSGFPLGIGLIVTLAADRRVRMLISFAVVAVVFASQSWWWQWLNAGQIQLRFEDWGAPIAEVNRAEKNLPILLFSNLIEDGEAFTDLDANFQEYLAFPLRGLPAVDRTQATIIPCPTLHFHQLSEDAWSKIKEQEKTWLIIRGSIKLQDALIDQLVRELQQRTGRPPTVIEAVFPSTPWSDVQLYQLTWSAAGGRF